MSAAKRLKTDNHFNTVRRTETLLRPLNIFVDWLLENETTRAPELVQSMVAKCGSDEQKSKPVANDVQKDPMRMWTERNIEWRLIAPTDMEKSAYQVVEIAETSDACGLELFTPLACALRRAQKEWHQQDVRTRVAQHPSWYHLHSLSKPLLAEHWREAPIAILLDTDSGGARTENILTKYWPFGESDKDDRVYQQRLYLELLDETRLSCGLLVRAVYRYPDYLRLVLEDYGNRHRSMLMDRITVPNRAAWISYRTAMTRIGISPDQFLRIMLLHQSIDLTVDSEGDIEFIRSRAAQIMKIAVIARDALDEPDWHAWASKSADIYRDTPGWRAFCMFWAFSGELDWAVDQLHAEIKLATTPARRVLVETCIHTDFGHCMFGGFESKWKNDPICKAFIYRE